MGSGQQQVPFQVSNNVHLVNELMIPREDDQNSAAVKEFKYKVNTKANEGLSQIVTDVSNLYTEYERLKAEKLLRKSWMSGQNTEYDQKVNDDLQKVGKDLFSYVTKAEEIWDAKESKVSAIQDEKGSTKPTT
jgi:hypothetical protein